MQQTGENFPRRSCHAVKSYASVAENSGSKKTHHCPYSSAVLAVMS